MSITNNYGNMRNANKIVIRIHKLRAGQYLFLFHTRQLLFKKFTDLQKIIEIKKNFALAQKPKCYKFEN